MNMVFRKFQAGLVLAFMLSASTALYAQTPRIDRIDIIEAGIYSAEITKKTPDSSMPSGYRNEIADLKLIERTTVIPGRVGTYFETKYKIVGSPLNEKVELRKVVRLPEGGMKDPATGEIFYRYERMLSKVIGETSVTGYNFEKDWEIVPGTWVFEFWYQDQKLAEQRFTVTKP
jgi:hypothetical protein